MVSVQQSVDFITCYSFLFVMHHTHYTTWQVFWAQIRQNWSFYLALGFLTGLTGLGLILDPSLWPLEYVLFGAGFFLFLFVGEAFVTAVHEMCHFKVVYRLGFTVQYTVHRVGNASWVIDQEDTLAWHQHQKILAAPYKSLLQHVSNWLFFLLALALAVISPPWLNLLLTVFAALLGLMAMAYTGGFVVVWRRLTDGFIYSFARFFTSGELGTIAGYNKRLKAGESC